MDTNKILITEADRYLFGNGTHYEIYEKMGAHRTCIDGKEGIYFAVWAPKAKAVKVVGSFNGWNGDGYEMTRLGDPGVYELFTEDAHVGDLYKFLIISENDEKLYKCDPYANYAQLRPDNASVIADINGFKWTDSKWCDKRQSAIPWEESIAIYEVHPGSWKKKDDGTEDGFYTYRELAVELAAYVKEMGYSHIELMGIAEYPFDGSWGYQVTGYYAPTARYGTPEDFMYFVNYMHSKGIGVILDWVPAHFPRDAHGLANFDGSAVYEYADPRKGEHPDWGTKVFDFGKNEVINFLIANALFWVEKYHVDGLRVDAVASMLYLDYGRQGGQWVPNKYGGNGNLEAMQFFRHLNSIMNKRNPGVLTIAEESTSWPAITKGPDIDGLGFTFKWNMGWMHDFLEYMKLDPYFRKGNHHRMTFSLTYAYSENFILVLSHDEVVHLKCSMLNKMPGEYREKFANLKAGYTFMIGHPGKKLIFMGQEFGQPSEWSEKKALDWYLLDTPEHKELQEYYKKLLQIYRKYPACSELDQYVEGFQWINANDGYRSIFSFVRKSRNGRNNLLFICHFTPVDRPEYRVGVPSPGKYTLLLNNNMESGEVYTAEKAECDGQPYSFAYKLPAYGTAIFKYNQKKLK